MQKLMILEEKYWVYYDRNRKHEELVKLEELMKEHKESIKMEVFEERRSFCLILKF